MPKWSNQIQIHSKLFQGLFWALGSVSICSKEPNYILFTKFGFVDFKLYQKFTKQAYLNLIKF